MLRQDENTCGNSESTPSKGVAFLRDMFALKEVEARVHKARSMYPDMRSAPEGYAILLEEVDELWAEIKKKSPDKEQMRQEALDVAAMAVRFIVDLC